MKWTSSLLQLIRTAQTVGINHARATTRSSYAHTLALNSPTLIKRAPNSFICFRSALSYALEIDSSAFRSECDLSRKAGDVWRDMSYGEQEPFIELAAQMAAEHKKMFPEYEYRPLQAGSARAVSKARTKRSRKKGHNTRARPFSSKEVVKLFRTPRATSTKKVHFDSRTSPSASPNAFFIWSSTTSSIESHSVSRFSTPESEEESIREVERVPEFTFPEPDDDEDEDLSLDLINFPALSSSSVESRLGHSNTTSEFTLLMSQDEVSIAYCYDACFD